MASAESMSALLEAITSITGNLKRLESVVSGANLEPTRAQWERLDEAVDELAEAWEEANNSLRNLAVD